MKQLKYILFGLIGLIFGGCNLLEVDTVSDITNEDYWQSPGDVESYLYGVYSQFRDLQNTTNYFEDRGDSFVPGMEGGPSNAWNQNLTAQNAPNWIDFYKVIQHCNMVIKYTGPMNFGIEADKNRLLAETYFMRAHTYFSLLRIWGDVPIELEPTENDNKDKLPRSPVADVMAQVLSDVNKAIELFPEEGYKNKSRASKPASYALKADALLWKAKVLAGGNADLEAAIEAADKAGAGLTLETAFENIFANDKKNGKEVIFSIYFEKDEKDGQYGKQLKPRDIFVQDAVNKNDIPYAQSGARSQYAPSPKLLAVFDEFSSDIRRSKSIITAVTAANTVIGVFDNKFRGSTSSGNRYYDSDIIIYRLAEMILFKAEALAALGRVNEAITELNKIRSRAGIPAYAGPVDKNAVESTILKERFREFYLELKRWPDLLRFHYAGTIDVYDEVPNLNGKSVPLYSPIPKTQIDRNPNLVQTEGYTE